MINNLDLALEAVEQAGIAIMSIYRQAQEVKIKEDGSPLTLADQNAHHAIVEVLRKSDLPIVSEENDDLHIEAQRYWLIDPVDGTKDFLAGNDEFTVNIALVENQHPVLGVLYAPALDELYVGGMGQRAWFKKAGIKINCARRDRSDKCRMAISRFHNNAEVDGFATANHIQEHIAIGSALKYGRIANAEVDIFPRLVGSSEWDTAAGQAVLEAAGGQVLEWHTGLPLRYGKKNRRNPRLLALRTPYRFSDFKLKHYEQELL